MDFDFMNLGVKRRRKDSAWPRDADRVEPQDDDLSEELDDQAEPFAEEPEKQDTPPEDIPARRRREDLSSLAGGEERLDALASFGEQNFLPEPEKKELKFEASKLRTALKHGPAEDAAEPLRKLDAAHRRTLGPKVARPKQPKLEETTHLPYLNREQQAADARRPDYKHKVTLVQQKLERTRDPQLRWTISSPQALSEAPILAPHGVTNVPEAPKTPDNPEGFGARFARFVNGLMGDASETAPTEEDAASALDGNRMRDAFERGQNTAREAAAAGYPGAVQVAELEAENQFDTARGGILSSQQAEDLEKVPEIMSENRVSERERREAKETTMPPRRYGEANPAGVGRHVLGASPSAVLEEWLDYERHINADDLVKMMQRYGDDLVEEAPSTLSRAEHFAGQTKADLIFGSAVQMASRGHGASPWQAITGDAKDASAFSAFSENPIFRDELRRSAFGARA